MMDALDQVHTASSHVTDGKPPDSANTVEGIPLAASWAGETLRRFRRGILRWRWPAAASLGAATILGALGYQTWRIVEPTIPARMALLLSLPYWYLCAALGPAVVWLCRRFPIQSGRWISSLVAHSIAGTLTAFFVLAADTWVSRLAGYWTPLTFSQAYRTTIAVWFHLTFVVYWVMVAVVHAAVYWRHYQSSAVAAARLETQLAQARLKALRMQLHPHFLFNTLNTISGCVRDHRPTEATEVIAGLADLLRQSLDGGGTHEVTLGEELQLVTSYLRIEQARLRERLRVATAVPHDLMQARVPTMILQPLVENAIRHGIGPRIHGGCIEVSGRRRGESLELRVRDDGPGFRLSQESPEVAGVGLGNTQARLRGLYGDRQSFLLSNDHRGGAVVTVTIPWHTEPNSHG